MNDDSIDNKRRPKFEIEEVQGPFTKTITKFVSGKGFVSETVKDETPRYDVYFPHGHTVRLTEPEARRQGFLKPAPVIEGEYGDEVEGRPEVSLKRRAEQIKSRNGGRRTVGLDAALAGEV